MADNIIFSSDPADDLNKFLNASSYSKISVLTDDNTLTNCYPVIRDGLPHHTVITVTQGEEHKNLETCQRIWQALTDQAYDRHSILIVLGGGVLGDMGGFCAATFKRGIDFILVPTTLLSQVDASIGGKLGIDFNHFKNHIGVFQLPALTLLHSGFLKTLPAPELRSGFAEILKHILISDAGLWKEIVSKKYETLEWDKLIEHSVRFKRDVVSRDPREKGLRKILNAGHTIGHALETHLLNKGDRVLHGEAIAAGLIAEGFIAVERKLLSEASLLEISNYIKNVYGKIDLTENDLEAIAELTIQDKKNKGNKILCVLLEGIGNAKWDCEISPDDVKRALSFYRQN